MKTLYLIILLLFFSFFIEGSEEMSFYVMKREYSEKKEVIKLSLDKKRRQELFDKINKYEEIQEKTWKVLKDKGKSNFLMTPNPESFSKYFLLIKYPSKVNNSFYKGIFMKNEPFSLYYIKLNGDNSDTIPVDIGYYSIEEFFTPEEKKKMLELIPEWRQEIKKELIK